jgi:3-deoxy-D-manno-octulosonate 8-phosphate phosphatase (KDO 8-P phosphatase)
MHNTENIFAGTFVVAPHEIAEKLGGIKAFIFDWDGVFNNGTKNEAGSSTFSDVDAMGTNLLRFNHFLRNDQPPLTAIISGEKNALAFTLAEREHFNAAYYSIKTKTEALHHFCSNHNIHPEQTAYFFDDVLDLGIAAQAGLRIMVGRECNPLLLQYARNHNLADYITAANGANNAVREAVEMLLWQSNKYDETITRRIKSDEYYNRYIQLRNLPHPVYYTFQNSVITQQLP